MQKKLIVSAIIVLLVIVMISDFKINKVKVFEDYVRQMETESIHKLQHGGVNLQYHGPRAEKTVSDKITVLPEVSELVIDNPAGSINITGEKRDDILLDYKVTVFADKKEQAEDFIDKVEVIHGTVKNRLILEPEEIDITNLPEGINGIKIEYTLKVPDHLFLDLENRYGRLDVRDIEEDVLLRNYYDKISVENINGDAEIYGRYGNVEVNDIHGSLNLDSRYNSVSIDTVVEDLDLEADYGQVRIDNIGGQTKIGCKYGSLSFNDIRGAIEIQSKYTQIRGADSPGPYKVELKYGQLDLSDIKKSVIAHGKYTGLEVDLHKDVNDYLVYCRTEYGSINHNLPFEIEKIENNIKVLEGKKGSGEVQIQLETDHADINVYK